MNSTRTYRMLALINAAFGAVVSAKCLASIFVLFSELEAKTDKPVFIFYGYFLVAVQAIIGTSLIYCAIAHLKKPSRKSALRLAANSAVIIWILLWGMLEATGLEAMIGPTYALFIPLGIACLSYRFFLMPAALNSFPADDKKD